MAKAATKQDAFEEEDVAGAAFDTDGDGSILVDLSDVEEQSFEVLPKGVYPVAIGQIDYSLSKNSGQPMWSVQLVVTEGEYTNRRLFTFISFSEKALPGSKKAIRMFAPELLQGPFDPKKIAEDQVLIGKQCRVRVDVEPYEGQDRNRVRGWLEGAGAAGGDGFVS